MAQYLRIFNEDSAEECLKQVMGEKEDEEDEEISLPPNKRNIPSCACTCGDEVSNLLRNFLDEIREEALQSFMQSDYFVDLCTLEARKVVEQERKKRRK